ncbi:siderophore-interacting protein [Leifsonia sp. 21MFCrub1.1]|uniref:siderophore-interacting protein n=1 Tax=Leifsonia sp. 21MFCrub1.1 TaxID=1798223 RepID=UPI0008929041|nr:siderophore-interacting protein [Leifsonia sp. 21MFCrub1.1]SEA61170.1 NADPH-dependent ferric siderophore reductase, contains FAD-binding and SIP domains [Leifsonia sp. 21MFCrub1.1]
MTVLAPTRTERPRPAYRPYRAAVDRIERLSPHFTRVSFRCDDFTHFGTECLDQRIKLLFPLADGSFSDLGIGDEEALAAGDWYERWRALPEHRRNPFRTYTVRAIDTDGCRLDVDFVMHGDGGPAARWLLGAAPGDRIVVIGPDARSEHRGVGIDWRPGEARELLLVGDETAAPAIASILESLPGGCRARAFVEVPSADDELELRLPANASVTWLPRGESVTGTALLPAVRRWLAENPHVVASASATASQQLDEVDVDRDILWETPEGTHPGFYAWIAGESAAVKTLRRLLVRDHGIDRSRVAFMGYWRLGRSEN